MKLIYGIGINDADYLVTVCPYYRVWRGMIQRCYSDSYQERHPNHKGCTVIDDWLTFSKFRAWMQEQKGEGLQRSKDLLFKGNKIYGPDTCVLITRQVKRFTNDGGTSRGELPVGVTRDKPTGKFRAQCHNPFTGKGESLGYFDSEQEAHEAWAKRKLELAQELTFLITDPRVANALIDRYLPQVRD